MADTISELQIEINAKAQNANDAIDRLVGKLDRLTTSLSRVNGTNLNGLANGVQRLGNAMQVMNTIKTADFTRLATNLTKLGTVNVSALNSAASSMSHLTRAFNSLGTVSANAQAVGEMAKNIAKLGNKSVQTAITNIPQLAIALKNLMATLSKAPRVNQNVIQMTNALANFASQGSKVGSASNSIVRGLNRTSASANAARKSFGGLASAIGKFYAKYFLVIRGLKGLWSSIESTADYIEAYNYFNVALGKIGSDWSYQFEKYGYDNAESYAESFSTRLSESLGKLSGLQVSIGADGQGLLTESGMKNLGLNIQEITQYASQLASVTNSVGQTGEVSLAVASSFTKLAGDISSLFNVDYSSVSKNLQSGLIGQSRALYKYGIDITNATLQTYAYELGLSKAVSEMTQAEKMQLRMIAILDQSKVAWGDLANTINSPSNMIRQFKNNLKETGIVLGQLFIPLLQKVMPIINGVTIAIKRLFVNIAGFLGIKIDFDAFGKGYSDLGDGIEDVSDAYDDATSSAKKYKSTTLGIDELNINAPQDESGSGGGVGGGIDLTDEILEATSEYERAWQEAYDQMENRAKVFADKIFKYLEPIQNLFEDIAIGDWFAVGEDVSDIASGIFNTFANAIKKVDWEQIGRNIGNFLKGINWKKILSSIGKLFWEALNGAIDLYKGLFDTAPIETAILSILALPAIAGFGKKLYDLIVVPLNNIATAISGAFAGVSAPIVIVVGAIVGALGYVFATNEDVRESFLDAVSAIKNSFQPAIEFVSNTVLPDLIGAFDRLVEILTPLWDFLENTFTSVWNDMINPALSYLGTDLLPRVVEVFKDLWENVLSPFADFVGDVLTPIIQIFSEILGILWENIVIPLSDAIGKTLKSAFEVVSEAIKAATEIVKPIIDVFDIFWNDILEPFVNFLWDILKPAFETVFGAVGDIIEFVSDAIDKFLGLADKAIETVEKLVDKFTGIASSDLLSNITANANITVSGGTAMIPNSVKTYATGGFPEDGWFRASRGEFMGSFDNGQSVVANNMQIIEGIKGGVKEAVAEILAPYLADIAESSRVTANKDFSVNIGDRDIARANNRGQRLIGYQLIT